MFVSLGPHKDLYVRNLITVFRDVMYIVVQLLTIPRRNFHTYLEVGASRVLRNAGD